MTTWEERRLEIRKRIAREGLDDFLSWSVIHATMWVGNAPYIPFEREAVSALLSQYSIDGTKSNVVHQLYHLKQWLDHTPGVWPEMHSEKMRIVEIGGGFGEMALLWWKMGYRGEYLIYDFPEMRQLQDYYLAKHGFSVGTAYPPFNCDLLIACCSLSEMDMEARSVAMAKATYPHFLVAYVGMWDGINNNEYFETWGGDDYPHPKITNIRYRVL